MNRSDLATKLTELSQAYRQDLADGKVVFQVEEEKDKKEGDRRERGEKKDKNEKKDEKKEEKAPRKEKAPKEEKVPKEAEKKDGEAAQQ